MLELNLLKSKQKMQYKEFKGYKAVDYIQYVWKTVFNIDYSKSKIRQDLKQGSVKLISKDPEKNDRIIKPDDIFVCSNED